MHGVADVKLSSAARRDLARIGEFSAAQFGDEVADGYLRGLEGDKVFVQRILHHSQYVPDCLQ
jgi:plasmid stabilization system protein ParE